MRPTQAAHLLTTEQSRDRVLERGDACVKGVRLRWHSGANLPVEVTKVEIVPVAKKEKVPK
jgi:hypothetical protein